MTDAKTWEAAAKLGLELENTYPYPHPVEAEELGTRWPTVLATAGELVDWAARDRAAKARLNANGDREPKETSVKTPRTTDTVTCPVRPAEPVTSAMGTKPRASRCVGRECALWSPFSVTGQVEIPRGTEAGRCALGGDHAPVLFDPA